MIADVTEADLARDLAADLEAYWDIQRDAQLGLILGPPKDGRGSGCYCDDVYEFANMAHAAWPAAMRLALHWKAEADRAKVSAALEAVRAEGAYAEGVKAGVGMERQRARQLRDAIREWSDSTDADLAS